MQHRMTIQRTLLLDTIKHLEGHVTAEQIYALLAKRYPQISKATVYRNLNLLEEEHQILRIAVPGAADYYESNTAPHYHIKCLECNQLTDVSLNLDKTLEQEIQDTNGFALLGHSLLFYGICPRCQQAHDTKTAANENSDTGSRESMTSASHAGLNQQVETPA